MKIALAQINPTVGDLGGNADKIVGFANQAKEQGAELVVFPELCITGYPPLDLLDSPLFIDSVAECVRNVADSVPQDIGVLVGAPVRNPSPVGKRLYNAAILLEAGEERARVYKQLLPTYDIFDEYRYFEPANSCELVNWRGMKFGIHVCEDMWNNLEDADFHLYDDNPVDRLAEQGADLYLNISASPFSVGKHNKRNEVIAQTCIEHGLPFVLVNTVGANTEIIFDGDSRVHAADGRRILCAPSFVEALLIWDTEVPLDHCQLKHSDVDDLYQALVMGIKDYFDKTGVFSKALVGLSGGIDSAVTCALAVAALGADNVVGVTMPSRYSSEGSVTDSRQLADNLGIEFHNIPIEPAVSAFGSMLDDVFGETSPGIAEENIQARSRGLTLMAMSNKFGYLLLSTGNKSEMSVGYATLYGDMSGGLAVLSDVYKSEVYKLANFINARGATNLIPETTITKPPSAELRPNQKDSDSLPDYPLLDDILSLYIEDLADASAIAEKLGQPVSLVQTIIRMVDRTEYKRKQAPPGLRVTSKAFGIGRRIPIVMKWNHSVGSKTVDKL